MCVSNETVENKRNTNTRINNINNKTITENIIKTHGTRVDASSPQVHQSRFAQKGMSHHHREFHQNKNTNKNPLRFI